MNDLNLKKLRAAIAEHAKPSTSLALMIFMTDLFVYVTAVAGVIFLQDIFLRILCSLSAGLWISLLFVVAHDAAHSSFTGSTALNKTIARISFLPCLHNYSLWLIAHNRLHHQLTNLKGENSWSPLSKEEYAAMPEWRKMLERFYRSPGGIGFNYIIERWWKNKFFPYQRITGEFKLSCWLDFLLVVTYLCAFLILLAYAGNNLARTSPAELIFLGFIIPMFYSSFMIGISVYQQHTHESIPWFRSRLESKKLGKQEKVTMHVRFPYWYNLLSHHVMQHTAHHIDPRIPLYNLPKAQQALTKLLGDKMVTVSFSLQGFLQTMSKCKLYDYENHRWLDFNGVPTSKGLFESSRIRYANAA